jgi:hypothetical protein
MHPRNFYQSHDLRIRAEPSTNILWLFDSKSRSKISSYQIYDSLQPLYNLKRKVNHLRPKVPHQSWHIFELKFCCKLKKVHFLIFL